MPWQYYYDATTGALRSEAQAEAPVSPLPVGWLVRSRATSMSDNEQWDSGVRDIVPRPAKIVRDRLQDLADDPLLAEVWSRLTPPQRTALRDRLIRLLGSQRWRTVGEPINFR